MSQVFKKNAVFKKKVKMNKKLTVKFMRDGRTLTAWADINTIQYINPGDVVKLVMDRRTTLLKGASFSGIKLGG